MIADAGAMEAIVRQGSRSDHGMVAFKDEIPTGDLEKIRAYLIHRANEDKRAADTAALLGKQPP